MSDVYIEAISIDRLARLTDRVRWWLFEGWSSYLLEHWHGWSSVLPRFIDVKCIPTDK
jgi:hypothetical protein